MNISECAKDPTLEYELQLLTTYPAVISLDEVGRGAIAGPVAVGAQVFTAEMPDFPEGLRDSKLLSEKRREELFPRVSDWGQGAVSYGSAADIDAHGISVMLGRAGRDCLLQLHEAGVDVAAAVILVDGKHDWLTPQLRGPLQVLTRVGADRACASVAAASVRAKVARDRLIAQAALEYPDYGWESNKGYGSKAHYAAIAEHGLTPLHRATWIKTQPAANPA